LEKYEYQYNFLGRQPNVATGMIKWIVTLKMKSDLAVPVFSIVTFV